jgi:hypothetical protein
VAFRDPWTRNDPRRTGHLLLCAGPRVKRGPRGPTSRSDCSFSDSRGLVPLTAGRVGAPCVGPPTGSMLLRQRGSRGATRVPRNARERFRADTVNHPRDTPPDCTLSGACCTVFSAPLLDAPAGPLVRSPATPREPARDVPLSSSRRHDTSHAQDPVRARGDAPASRQRAPRPDWLHRKLCSPAPRPDELELVRNASSAGRSEPFRPVAHRACGLALFLLFPCARSAAALVACIAFETRKMKSCSPLGIHALDAGPRAAPRPRRLVATMLGEPAQVPREPIQERASVSVEASSVGPAVTVQPSSRPSRS